MPFFVADWQVANHLRPCGEVAAVRFQRNGEGAALCRFVHHTGAANALRWGEVSVLGVRVFILPAWCESSYHAYPGHCSNSSSLPQGSRQHAGHSHPPGGGMSSVTYRHGQTNMPDVNGNTGDWCVRRASPPPPSTPPLWTPPTCPLPPRVCTSHVLLIPFVYPVAPLPTSRPRGHHTLRRAGSATSAATSTSHTARGATAATSSPRSASGSTPGRPPRAAPTPSCSPPQTAPRRASSRQIRWLSR
jgi:hypothetical protein